MIFYYFCVWKPQKEELGIAGRPHNAWSRERTLPEHVFWVGWWILTFILRNETSLLMNLVGFLQGLELDKWIEQKSPLEDWEGLEEHWEGLEHWAGLGHWISLNLNELWHLLMMFMLLFCLFIKKNIK